MMNGQTQLVGILGWPVAHSRSPAMHNAAFKHLGLNWAYVPLPVNVQFAFATAVKGLSACGFRGANVTVPYKEEAARLVNDISDEAQTIGAVNTLVFLKNGAVRGENTDAPGFLAHLTEEKVKIGGQHVAVIGAGGAARAIVYALLKGGAKRVSLVNRTRARALELVSSSRVQVLNWSRPSFEEAAQASLVVNTTSLGLHEGDMIPWHSDVKFGPSQVVYDAIYRRTPFLEKANHDGARAITGAGMLLWQGAIAFELWTGVKAPVDVMKLELKNA